jgi:hypothetical protein
MAPDSPLFRTLDDVPWAELTHAYGSAADIPEHFRLLTSPDRQIRDGVFENFYGNIFHQGSVYPATVAAIPFLIEAAAHPRMPDRVRILVLLAHLAVGYPEELVVKGFDGKGMLALGDPHRPRKPSEEEEDGDDANYGDLMRQCYAEVGGLPVPAPGRHGWPLSRD